VAITASLNRGNSAVANLTAADFVVTENSVTDNSVPPQTVEALSIRERPAVPGHKWQHRGPE
jgi:hypothetical protein